MNTATSKRVFQLFPNGYFFSFLGNSYFCGRYQGEDRPPKPIEITYHFPFDRLFVDFYMGELRINHELSPYRFYTGSAPLTIFDISGYANKYVGRFDSLYSLTIVNDELLANGDFVDRVRDFPAQRFELNLTDISRANMFIGMGYNNVRFIYSWYKRIFFMSFGIPWFTLYLRVAYRLDVDNE